MDTPAHETPRHAVITGFLSRTRDRFHEYNEERSLEERLQMVTDMEAIDGIEVVFPYEVRDAAAFRRLLDRFPVSLAAVNVNVKAEPEFLGGGLTSTDPAVRKRAVQFIRDAKTFARDVGANKVTCCPLGDGYEFNFHCDYRSMWRHLVDSFARAADHLPDIPLFVEYKPSETRGRCFVDTASKALCLLHDVARPGMGITLDFGHSLYGQENPAEVVALLAASPYPFYIHINDNDGRWDWDYMVGTKHLLDYAEFLFYLQEMGYDDYFTSDTSPTRWDIRGTFEMNARVTNKLWRRLLHLDRDRLRDLIARRDYLETWRFLEEQLLCL